MTGIEGTPDTWAPGYINQCRRDQDGQLWRYTDRWERAAAVTDGYPAPTFQAVPLRCGKCAHEWTGHIANNCTFDLAIASFKAISKAGCPGCLARGKHVLIVTTNKAEPDASRNLPKSPV